jgi:hypothetical protein
MEARVQILAIPPGENLQQKLFHPILAGQTCLPAAYDPAIWQ